MANSNNSAEFDAEHDKMEIDKSSIRSVKGRNDSLRSHASIRHPMERPRVFNGLSRNKSSQNYPQRPHYSLAGNTQTAQNGRSYVHPKYHELNPGYQKSENGPLWGLANPLPRVVRSGMLKRSQHEDVVEDKDAERRIPGSAEVVPQLGMIDDQREDAGKQVTGEGDGRGDRGYGRHMTGNSYLGRAESRTSRVEQVGPPMEERGDPMDEMADNARPGELDIGDPLDDWQGDLGSTRMNRLPSVKEIPSQPVSSLATVRSHIFSGQTEDTNSVDLEAGKGSGDWPLEEDEANEYAMEERDSFNMWSTIRARFREPLAECLATMVAVLIGVSANLGVQTSANTAGDFQSTNWAWGFGVMIGVYIAGGISGGHLNPAISITLWLYRGFPFRKVLIYITAQLLGAFLAGLIAYGIYYDTIHSFDAAGGQQHVQGEIAEAVDLINGGTGRSFYTEPAQFVGAGAAFANEFVATAILSCAILALGDDSNAPPGAGMHALIVGLVVTALTMAFGYNTGANLNPARDFGPRAAAAVVGYGGEVFVVRKAWWLYGAWGATVSGALVGGLVYDGAIFVGGESPVNFSSCRRRRVRRRWWDFRLGWRGGMRGDKTG